MFREIKLKSLHQEKKFFKPEQNPAGFTKLRTLIHEIQHQNSFLNCFSLLPSRANIWLHSKRPAGEERRILNGQIWFLNSICDAFMSHRRKQWNGNRPNCFIYSFCRDGSRPAGAALIIEPIVIVNFFCWDVFLCDVPRQLTFRQKFLIANWLTCQNKYLTFANNSTQYFVSFDHNWLNRPASEKTSRGSWQCFLHNQTDSLLEWWN